MNLAALITARRQRLGLSIRGLAKKCGVSFSQISRIEAGEATDVTVRTVVELAKGVREKPGAVFEAAVETLEGPNGAG